MLLTHALAHYLHGGPRYTWDIRSHVALKELRPGQERHMIQINDLSGLYRIRGRLERDAADATTGHARE